VADAQQLTEQDDDRLTRPAAVELRRAFDDSSIASATVEDGNTVLRLTDRSTITLVGIARIDQLTWFSRGRRRALRRVS
jgi:hypothetical protein